MKFILILFYILLALSCQSKLDLSPLPIGGDFSYSDKSGKMISLKDFKEPVILVFFGYTQCPDFCPNILSKLKKTKLLLSEESKFRIVFISIDPSRDDPNTVQKYVDFYSDNATGLSFNESTTALIVKKYAAYVEKANDPSLIDHSTYIYVLDTERKTRALLKSNESAEHYAEVIKVLSGDSI